MPEALRKRVERGLSESCARNNDFYRIPTRFTTRYIPQYPTMRRLDSDKPLPPIKRLRALRQPGYRLHDVSRPSLTFAGPQVTPSGPNGHESRNKAFDPARGASQPEFRGFHESRDTKHELRLFFETRLFFALGAGGRRHRKPPSGPLPPPASRCFFPLFAIVHHCSHCSPLFTIVRHCSDENIVRS